MPYVFSSLSDAEYLRLEGVVPHVSGVERSLFMLRRQQARQKALRIIEQIREAVDAGRYVSEIDEMLDELVKTIKEI